ncbi:MAG TPA: lysophospholipid acyltransferase family protein [Actinomycetota bacterium]
MALPPVHLWFNWRLEGLERIPPEGPLIVAGNHLSYFDPLAHGHFVDRANRRPRFLAKRELFDNWFLRTVLLGAGQIPVARGTGDRAPLLEAAQALEAGEVVVVYPEGTSITADADFSPGPGKNGAVRLSLMTGIPILPVATWGGQYVWRRGERIHPTFGRPIWLKAGEPYDVLARGDALEERDAVENRDAVRELTDGLMRALTALVSDMRARYPKRWARG